MEQGQQMGPKHAPSQPSWRLACLCSQAAAGTWRRYCHALLRHPGALAGASFNVMCQLRPGCGHAKSPSWHASSAPAPHVPAALPLQAAVLRGAAARGVRCAPAPPQPARRGATCCSVGRAAPHPAAGAAGGRGGGGQPALVEARRCCHMGCTAVDGISDAELRTKLCTGCRVARLAGGAQAGLPHAGGAGGRGGGRAGTAAGGGSLNGSQILVRQN